VRPRLIEFLQLHLGLPGARYVVPTSFTIMVLAVALVMWVMVIRGKRIGLSPRIIVGASLTAVLAGIVGARLFHLLQHVQLTVENPHLLLRLHGGTTSWGAYIAGTLGFALYLRARHQAVLPHADLLASCLGLGPLVGRWACFLNGCCFGTVSHLPWAVRFPRFSFPYEAQLDAGLIDAGARLSLPVHPVQLYSATAGLLLFVAASRFWARQRSRPGLTFAFYWLLYAVFRFCTEFLRGDVPRHVLSTLTLSQAICLIIIVLAGLTLWRRRAAIR
jgi:phosphatidylglycerol:prolipoprotein diacylglycerol transferase